MQSFRSPAETERRGAGDSLRPDAPPSGLALDSGCRGTAAPGTRQNAGGSACARVHPPVPLSQSRPALPPCCACDEIPTRQEVFFPRGATKGKVLLP